MNAYYDEEYRSWNDENHIQEKKIRIASHRCAITSIKMIIEELYESDGEIDHELLRENFACICDEFGLDDYPLQTQIKLTRRHPLFSLAYDLSKSCREAVL